MLFKKLFVSASIATAFLICNYTQASFLSKLKNAVAKSQVVSALKNSQVGQAIRSDLNNIGTAAVTGATNLGVTAYQDVRNVSTAAATGITDSYNQKVNTTITKLQNLGQTQVNQNGDAITKYTQAKVAYEISVQTGASNQERYEKAMAYSNAATEYKAYISTAKQSADEELAQATQQYQTAAQAAAVANNNLQTAINLEAAAQQILQTEQKALQTAQQTTTPTTATTPQIQVVAAPAA